MMKSDAKLAKKSFRFEKHLNFVCGCRVLAALIKSCLKFSMILKKEIYSEGEIRSPIRITTEATTKNAANNGFNYGYDSFPEILNTDLLGPKKSLKYDTLFKMMFAGRSIVCKTVKQP